MARKIYSKNNYIVIDNDDASPLMYFPKGSTVLLDDVNSYSLTANLNGSGGGNYKNISYADISNWYDETGLIPYSNSTLVEFITSNTGFKLAGGSASSTFSKRVIIKQASDLNITLQSDVEYFLDGVIDLTGTGINLEIPSGGIYITGYNFDVSGLVCSDNNYTLFTSESIANGSGNVLFKDFYIEVSGASSQVYELYADTGFEALEVTRVNYIDCTDLGDLHGYRQGLEEGTGRFGGSPSLTLHGLWRGGFRVTTSIVRSLANNMTKPLFEAGNSFQMNSRFLTDLNCDLSSNASFCDFSAANFPNPSTLQIKGAIISRDGVFNANDTNIFPNLSASDLPCDWDDNIGIANTFIGGAINTTGEVASVIATQNASVPLGGTFIDFGLQHFDSPNNGELRHIGINPREYLVTFDFVLAGQQSSEYEIFLLKQDASVGTPSVEYRMIRVINNLQGGRDVAYYNGQTSVILNQNERIFWHVANITGAQNCTLEVDSSWSVKER